MTAAKGRTKKRSRHKLRKMPFLMMLFFLLLAMFGVVADEPMRVLEQARQICLSCIGIG